nr:TolC family protein [Succinivibrio sp.]
LDVPARLLSRRPDLMAKEALLRKALSDYDSARLAFYPDFTLTLGLSSGDSVSFGRFLSNPLASLGAALTMPFLNWHKLKLKEQSAYKSEELAAVNFVNTYLTAVKEVYDQVSAIDYYRKSVKLTAKTLKVARRNYTAYYDRYAQGGASLSDLLDAADTLRSTELSHLNVKRDALESVMGLLVALGGDTDKMHKIEER